MGRAEVRWTDNQEAAITAAGTNVLVSAAAGSGKTTVLVERVIRMLTRKENPVEIDRLLIMTFTRAAAASMRSKIYNAIKVKCEEDPSNMHLQMQLAKLPMAYISTIDSFCAGLVRENFQDADIDPAFRMADEAEIRLLKQDVLKEILENHYQEPEPEFLEFVQYYTDKNDNKLEDLILTLFAFAESHPAPKEWLRQSILPYQDAKTLYADYDPSENPWMQMFLELVLRDFAEVRSMAEEGLAVSVMNHGPAAYEERFREILDFLDSLEGQPFDNRRYLVESFLADWKRSPSISKKEDVEEDLKTLAKDLRASVKKKLEKILSTWLYQDLEQMFQDMAACAPVAQTLFALTLEFSDTFLARKKEKKIADFSDIAHYALEILLEYQEDGSLKRGAEGRPVYTEVADRMAQSLDEIIVDEYQDTNLLQEYLIGALSKERFGSPNVFMVGDVKQSIYGFRMACPQLFIEKFDGYRNKSLNGRLIILDQNFRSREEILHVTNHVFEKTMIRGLGGIEYTEGHALSPGRETEEADDAHPAHAFDTEIFMIEGSGEQAKQSEAYEIAERIEKLVSEEGFSYADIVLLSRTTDNPAVEKMLSARGIPFLKSAKRGFFDSFEIRLVLDLLTVIDNPYQDIPLAAVLMSPLCNVSAEELARIKTGGTAAENVWQEPETGAGTDGTETNVCAGGLYERLLAYAPLSWFTEKLSAWQQKQSYMEIEEFLEYLLQDSGLYDFLLAMPNGRSRKANLDFLKDKTKAFANGPYTGLFHFIRFVKEIRDASMDYGQAQVASREANAVQMMTIHASKGLEFPVVFLVNAGKGQNDSDLKSTIILDRELGVGMECREKDSRLIRKSILMETIRQKKYADQYAEELRLLYVAMTRAQDKLIITGIDRSLSKHKKEWAQTVFRKGGTLPVFKILGAKTYLRLLGLTLSDEAGDDIRILYKAAREAEEERAETLLADADRKSQILSLISGQADTSRLEKELGYVYPYGKAAQIQAKISPSRLEAEPKERHFFEEEGREWTAPAGLGAERGNAYHRFLELLDYHRTDEADRQLEEAVKNGKLTAAGAGLIDLSDIRKFLESDLGKRMQRAAENGTLKREQTFLMGIRTDINHSLTVTGAAPTSDLPDEEILLVQGVIDAYFEEDGNVVLVDYKTDRHIGEEELKERYRPQQEAYADALEKLHERPVTEKYLYSFWLGKAIRLS